MYCTFLDIFVHFINGNFFEILISENSYTIDQIFPIYKLFLKYLIILNFIIKSKDDFGNRFFKFEQMQIIEDIADILIAKNFNDLKILNKIKNETTQQVSEFIRTTIQTRKSYKDVIFSLFNDSLSKLKEARTKPNFIIENNVVIFRYFGCIFENYKFAFKFLNEVIHADFLSERYN